MSLELTVDSLPNVESHPHLASVYAAWILNQTYRILLSRAKNYHHIRVRRLDDAPIVGVDILQAIKNHFFGEECVAVMVFPAQQDYIATTNTYHLFTWEGIQAPNLVELYHYSDAK